jgi:chaperonin GroES
VLIKHIDEDEQVRDGIIIPDSAKEKPQEAEVIALGTGAKDGDGNVVAFNVKVGDRVLTSKYGGTEVKIDGQTHLLVREDDILGIIES